MYINLGVRYSCGENFQAVSIHHKWERITFDRIEVAG